MQKYSLGISYGYHDSAICLIGPEGKVEFAAQEERYSRRKNDSNFPSKSIEAGLKYLGIDKNDIESVAYYEDSNEKIARICRFQANTCAEILGERFRLNPGMFNMKDILKSLFPQANTINHYPHHLSHAASVALSIGSKKKEYLAIVLDGVGEFDSTSIWHFNNNEVKRVGGTQIPHSIGLIYAAITSFLGFEVNEGEYKVMGLASYGQPRFANRLRSLISLKNRLEDLFIIDQTHLDLTGSSKLLYKESLAKFIGLSSNFRIACSENYDQLKKEIFQEHADLAASLQIVTNEMIEHVFRVSRNNFPKIPLGYSGGVALNCAANRNLLAKFGDIDFQPACGDAGGAMGSALLSHYRFKQSKSSKLNVYISTKSNLSKGNSTRIEDLLFLGEQYSNEHIRKKLYKQRLKDIIEFKSTKSMIDEAAKEIIKGNILGWHQGRMEWGPRALGSRSIIASPLGKETQSKINKAIKFRESFRPFAPIVLKSFYNEFINSDNDSLQPSKAHLSMLSVVKVTNSIQSLFPACVHIDQTSRIQILDDNSNLAITKLLLLLKELGHPPVIVNTSFNVKGEPIVCTVEDAIGTFWQSGLDSLYIGNFKLTRKSLQIDHI